MKKSIKAVLLSAFVFPGAGHFLLKRYISGAVLAGAAFSGLYYLTARTVENALEIVTKIQSGEAQLDAEVITELVSRQVTGTETLLINIATMAVLVSWLIGIVDSYRVGRAQEKMDISSPL